MCVLPATAGRVAPVRLKTSVRCVDVRRSMCDVVSWPTSVWTLPSVMDTQRAWTCSGPALL